MSVLVKSNHSIIDEIVMEKFLAQLLTVAVGTTVGTILLTIAATVAGLVALVSSVAIQSANLFSGAAFATACVAALLSVVVGGTSGDEADLKP